MNDPRDLTRGPVRAHLVRLTVPMTWGLVALMTFNLVDTLFVGRLGTHELAAMSFTFPVVMVLTSLAIGLGAGTSSVVARAIGARDGEHVRRLATDSMVLAGLLVAALTMAGLVTIEPLFRLLGANGRTLPLVEEYMEIWYVGLIFLVVPMVGMSALRAAGDSRGPALILIGSSILNLVLDPLLIFGLAGLPRLELRGAALASLVARVGTLVATLLVLHVRERMLTAKRPGLRLLLRSWREILHIGLPAAATNMIIPLSLGVVTALLASYGPEAVAAFGAAGRVEALALVLFFAMSSIIGPVVGQNLGAGERQRVADAMTATYRFCMVWGLGTAAVLGLLHAPLAEIFSDQPRVVTLAGLYLLVVPISYGPYGVVMMANAAFNGLGLPMRGVFISVLRMLALYVPLALLGSYVLGVPGIFLGASLANLLAGLAAWLLTRHTCSEDEWRKLEGLAPSSRPHADALRVPGTLP